jgi:hypothetical protein
VYLRLATALWMDKPGMPALRRSAALLGIFAILIQAVLFAEHHHPLPVFSQGAPAPSAAAPATDHDAPGRAGDDCQICFGLAHHSAAPIVFAAASPPTHTALRTSAIGAVVAPGVAPFLLFHSRAPPRA